MENKNYRVEAIGQFSFEYGRDTGFDIVGIEETNDEFHSNELTIMGRYVEETFCNEHEGSRSVELIVNAADENEARFYAEAYGKWYYPEK